MWEGRQAVASDHHTRADVKCRVMLEHAGMQIVRPRVVVSDRGRGQMNCLPDHDPTEGAQGP